MSEITMSVGQRDTDLAGRIPQERIGEACRRWGVSQLWVHGPILERDPGPMEEVEFLVEFINFEIIIIGAGIKRLSPDLLGRHPQVWWSEVVGMRDRVAHSSSRQGMLD